MEIKIIPITVWIGKKNKSSRSSQFRATYKDTLKILKFELEKADIYGDAQLQMFIHPADMRLDGNMRANAKPYAPGVKLVFKRRADKFYDEDEKKWKQRLKTVSYPCDAFDDWQDNLRAIALSMEALRKVERYGVFEYSDLMDRLALPSADGKISTAEEAAQTLAKFAGYLESPQNILDSRALFLMMYRTAAGYTHPDSSSTGSHEKFLKVQDARKILEDWFANK
jgi:hypothetical protein